MKINMKKYLRILIIFVVGIVSGIYLYVKYSQYMESSVSNNDMLEVDALFAHDSAIEEEGRRISSSRQTAITEAVNKVSPAVVSVSVLQVFEYRRRSPLSDPLLREFFPELFKDRYYQQKIQSIGSGFIISADGYILTNDHVVEDASEIVITMAGGNEFKAETIGSDPRSDLALLKIDKKNLPYCPLGNSDKVLLGEWAIAIGNPFGLFERGNRSTVTVGVISAVDRDFGEIEGRVYQDMIQTDASINTGNSGGPLCNAAGEVIAMNTFIYTGSRHEEGSVGIGFAIPINRIINLLDDLKKYHKIDRDFWIGIRVRSLDTVTAEKMGYSIKEGALVTSIERGSPASKAGLKLGDVIVEINSKKIKSDEDVIEIVYYDTDLRVDDKLKLKVLRDDSELSLILVLASIRNN
jgi:serine protease Do